MNTTVESVDWLSCQGCGWLVCRRRFERLVMVCPGCGRHGPLTVPQPSLVRNEYGEGFP